MKKCGMKIPRLLSAAFAGALLLITAGPTKEARAWMSTFFDTSTIINVSSQPASPSTIVPAINFGYASVEIWCYQLNLAGEQVLINSSTVGFSTSTTTGTARINCTLGTVAPEHFIISDYTGPIYAVAKSTYTIPVNVIRKR